MANKKKSHQASTANELLSASRNNRDNNIRNRKPIEEVNNSFLSTVLDNSSAQDLNNEVVLSESEVFNFDNQVDNIITNLDIKELTISEAAFLVTNNLLNDEGFLPRLSAMIAQRLIKDMDKQQQFGYVKKFGKKNQLVILKESIDAFVEELLLNFNNEVKNLANTTFIKVKNG